MHSSHEDQTYQLFDLGGRLRLSVPENGPGDGRLRHFDETYFKAKERFFSGSTSTSPAGGLLMLSLLLPVRDRRTRMFLSVCSLSGWTLFCPCIRSSGMPTESPTSELLLVRREGDEVVHLSNLRHAGTALLSHRLPLKDASTIAAPLALGRDALWKGTTIAAGRSSPSIRNVPARSGRLSRKPTPRRSTLAIRANALNTGLLIAGLISVAGVSLGLLRTSQNARFYRREYELEAERLKDGPALRSPDEKHQRHLRAF